MNADTFKSKISRKLPMAIHVRIAAAGWRGRAMKSAAGNRDQTFHRRSSAFIGG